MYHGAEQKQVENKRKHDMAISAAAEYVHVCVYLLLIRSLKETRPANLSRSLPSARVLELILHSTLMSVFMEAFRNLTATSG